MGQAGQAARPTVYFASSGSSFSLPSRRLRPCVHPTAPTSKESGEPAPQEALRLTSDCVQSITLSTLSSGPVTVTMRSPVRAPEGAGQEEAKVDRGHVGVHHSLPTFLYWTHHRRPPWQRAGCARPTPRSVAVPTERDIAQPCSSELVDFRRLGGPLIVRLTLMVMPPLPMMSPPAALGMRILTDVTLAASGGMPGTGPIWAALSEAVEGVRQDRVVS